MTQKQKMLDFVGPFVQLQLTKLTMFDRKFGFYASRSPYNRILRSEIGRLAPKIAKTSFEKK